MQMSVATSEYNVTLNVLIVSNVLIETLPHSLLQK